MSQKVGYKRPPPPDPKRYPSLSPSDRKVLYFLTDFADQQGSRTVQLYAIDIAKSVGMTRRSVMESLRRLRQKEHISTERVKTPYGYVASRYTILNPDADRRQKIVQACNISGIPIDRMIDYVYWVSFHRGKLAKMQDPTVGDIAYFAKCPAHEATNLVQGLFGSGILLSPTEVNF